MVNAAIDRPEILVAEDNPADVRLIREALRGLDPAPCMHAVTNGEEALEFLRQHQEQLPVLLFLDFHLPKTDSAEVLRKIKTDERLCGVAVVVLTTWEVEETIWEAYRLGANCYLSKPSDLEEFLYTIRSATSYWLGLAAHHRASAG
jgi:CheY-like chemotaxis protein